MYHLSLLLSARHPQIPRLVLVSPPRLSPLSGAAALVLLPEIDPPIAPAEAAGAVEPGGGRVEVVAGADRRFLSGLRALGNAAVAWIEAERGGRH